MLRTRRCEARQMLGPETRCVSRESWKTRTADSGTLCLGPFVARLKQWPARDAERELTTWRARYSELKEQTGALGDLPTTAVTRRRLGGDGGAGDTMAAAAAAAAAAGESVPLHLRASFATRLVPAAGTSDKGFGPVCLLAWLCLSLLPSPIPCVFMVQQRGR
jgi:hypothetical protein